MLQKLFQCNNCGRDLLRYPHDHSVRTPIYRDGQLVGASTMMRGGFRFSYEGVLLYE